MPASKAALLLLNQSRRLEVLCRDVDRDNSWVMENFFASLLTLVVCFRSGIRMSSGEPVVGARMWSISRTRFPRAIFALGHADGQLPIFYQKYSEAERFAKWLSPV
jgi:hypothetical protein